MSEQSNPNEQQIRDALRGVADTGGPVDEGAAWASIQRGVQADERSSRRRLLLGGTGLAIAGAAAALVLVVGTGDDEEAVEVGPAAEATTTSSTSTTGVHSVPIRPEATTTTAVPSGGGLPAHPLAVAVQLDGGTTRLDLYDADTGALVTQGLAETTFSFDDLEVLADGTVVYTEELGDSSTVRLVPWDGSAEPVTPYGLELDIRSGTFDANGEVFFFVEQGVERPQGRIGILGGDGGDIRYLEWADGEEDFFLTQGRIDDLELSPDGEQLVFTSNYEGEEVRVVDVDASSLSDSVSVFAGTDPAWLGDGLLVVRSCCYPEFDEPKTLHEVRVNGDEVEQPFADEAVAVAADIVDRVAVALPDGTISVTTGTGEPVASIDPDGTPLQLGL